ncbi:hypothetical protein ABZY90_19485 [Streptomyces sp. NPDC006422]|uniref:hypothetical protein n=1 Tax=unclassified Streptomyces TaxID=2593676 RepID=UPI0033B335C1
MSVTQPPDGARSVEELNEAIRRLMLASGGWLSDEQRVVYADLVTAWSLASRRAAACDEAGQAQACPGPAAAPRGPRRGRRGRGPVLPIPHPAPEAMPEDPVAS